jgi:hypothetical protein
VDGSGFDLEHHENLKKKKKLLLSVQFTLQEAFFLHKIGDDVRVS